MTITCDTRKPLKSLGPPGVSKVVNSDRLAATLTPAGRPRISPPLDPRGRADVQPAKLRRVLTAGRLAAAPLGVGAGLCPAHFTARRAVQRREARLLVNFLIGIRPA